MTTLRDAMHELVPRIEHQDGDWEDVLRRANAARPPIATKAAPARRRWTLIAAALFAVMVSLFATPAFGLRDAVLDLIGREDVTFEEGARAPQVVRKQFEDLALGVPSIHDPQVQPEKMREVGTFRLSGRDRTLWAGPTRRGGFCYSLEGRVGGCLADPRSPLPAPIAHSLSGRQRPGEPFEVLSVTGWVFVPEAERLTLGFEDGTSRDLPFVYISPPIDAGFFAYGTTSAQRRAPHRPSTVVVSNARGEVLARAEIAYAFDLRPSPLTKPQPPRKLPARPPVAPSEPRRTSEARGVTVTAGANGAVFFDATGGDAVVNRMRGKGATFVCFTFLDNRTQTLGHYGRFDATVGLRHLGLETPIDGCEIRGTYGHRWPDRFDSHSPVEVAFTPAAKRYYLDRAAARDLALFVRSGKVQELRKLESTEREQALRVEFGGSIDFLDAERARPDVGRIGVWIDDEGITFREISPTGRAFEVEVAGGRIVRENVDPLAMVF